MRIGLIGARRRRQGLGPFVARDLAAAGAEVSCFLATGEASRDEAARRLAEESGIEARGHLDLERMLDDEPLDALAILSPAETHAAYLEAAAAHGLHVLCEKPFVWGVPRLAEQARDRIAAFEKRGLVLWENCQWPASLGDYARLHPGSTDAPPRRLAMRLQPASAGLQRIGDAVPHPLSLLQALAPHPDPALEDIRYGGESPLEPLTLRFVYRAGSARVGVEVQLEPARAFPRESELAIDGTRARRVVDPHGYRLFFVDGPRRVALPDPLTQRVGAFVSAVRDGGPSQGSEIGARMQLLEAIVDACPAELR